MPDENLLQALIASLDAETKTSAGVASPRRDPVA
jgi:hypothetical protein